METWGRVPVKLYLQKSAGSQTLAGPPEPGRQAPTASGFTAQCRLCARKAQKERGVRRAGLGRTGPRGRTFCTEGSPSSQGKVRQRLAKTGERRAAGRRTRQARLEQWAARAGALRGAYGVASTGAGLRACWLGSRPASTARGAGAPLTRPRPSRPCGPRALQTHPRRGSRSSSAEPREPRAGTSGQLHSFSMDRERSLQTQALLRRGGPQLLDRRRNAGTKGVWSPGDSCRRKGKELAPEQTLTRVTS